MAAFVRQFRAGWIVLCCLLAGQAAFAQAANEARFALVVGNARYAGQPLANPENDSRLIATRLRGLGFKVSENQNLGVRDFRRVLRDFVKQVQDQDGVVVFYYAGHGVQIEGRNYLLPVDVDTSTQEEVKDNSIDIDDLFVSRLEKVRAQTRVVILDACRNNPWATASRGIRAAGGLAEMNARGTLIAYASAPGATAEDGPAGTNSVYTKHLAEEMLVDGLEVEQMFKRVRVKVLADTKERQVPWVNTSLTTNFSFSGRPQDDGGDARRQEQIARLEDELKQTRGLLERAQGGAAGSAPATAAANAAGADARAAEVASLQQQLQRSEQALQAARVASKSASGPVTVTAARTAANAPDTRQQIRARADLCADLLTRISIGEPLSDSAQATFQKECRK